MINSDRLIKRLLFILLAIFMILPQYIYVVASVNLSNCCLLIICVVFLLFYGKIYKFNIRQNIFWYWIFALYVVLNTFLTSDFLGGVTTLLTYLFIPVVVISIIRFKEDLYYFIDAIIFVATVVGVFGLFEVATSYNFFQQLAPSYDFFIQYRYGMLCIMGPFGQHIGYGLYVAFILSLIVYRINTRSYNTLYYISYAILLINLIFSFSKTAWVLFIIIHIYFLYKRGAVKLLMFILALVAIMLFAFLLMDALGINSDLITDLYHTLVQFFSEGEGEVSASAGVGDRFDIFIWVAESMNDNWLFGNGAGAEFAYEVYPWQIKTSIENQYLNLLYQGGVVCLGLMILCYISIIIKAYKNSKTKSIYKVEKYFSFSQMCFILFIGYTIVGFATQETDMTRTFVVFVSLLISVSRLNSRGVETQKIHSARKYGIKCDFVSI